MIFRQRSIRDQVMDQREAAGLPVLSCPNCGARVDHRSGHWMPERIDEYGLIVPGYYTCEGDAA